MKGTGRCKCGKIRSLKKAICGGCERKQRAKKVICNLSNKQIVSIWNDMLPIK